MTTITPKHLVVMSHTTQSRALTTAIHVVVMAKPAVPGRVKTRLARKVGPDKAAAIHAAMLDCILQRAGCHITRDEAPISYILALDETLVEPGQDLGDLDVDLPVGWRVIPQGTGDLGDRLGRVWQQLGNGPIVFLGADTPDVPSETLDKVLPTLESADVAIGPVADGGYWTLAAHGFEPSLLTSIDWGTSTVYHQTVTAASQAGLSVATLPLWHDVDQPADLTRLHDRLHDATEAAFVRLRSRLSKVLNAKG